MQSQQFEDILRSVPLMSPEQVNVLHTTLPLAANTVTSNVQAESRFLERLKFYFDQHPVCVRCRSAHVNRWGSKDGHQRYCCKDCGKTFNAMSGSIAEEDETFFHESHKGDRKLQTPRKRGARSQRKSRHAKTEKKASVPLIPVMVACDRNHHVIDAVLKKVSTEELQSQLEGRILAGSTLCFDAHLAHEHLAEKLSLTAKTLVSSSGERVKEGIYHIQTVNAYHSELKRWINGFFKGVATKYLQRYLGWKRYLKTHMFSIEGFLDQISIHWAYQHIT
ncbi:IS1595 family transposase [Endozoicomonas atrinae]|uniref:IS1595 family transposase n=1 Tax=Endozoicomonas atrinae TaxID=1333660 RepID=UPI003AFFFC0F